MQAFTTAITADNQHKETETDHLRSLRNAIQSALSLSENGVTIFDAQGLDRDNLKAHDLWIEDAINHPHAHSILNAEDIDIIIPFISKLGQAYNQFMANSLMNDPEDTKAAHIEQAASLYPTLNFFYAQQAKLYPNAINEPTYRNE